MVALPIDAPDPGRWRRRALSFSLVALLLPLTSAASLPVLALVLVRDLVFDRRLPWTRASLLLWWVLICEAWGLALLAIEWLASLVLGREWLARETAATQRLWTGVLMRAVLRLFSMKIEVVGAEAVETAPFVLLARHASTADVLLPMQVAAIPHGLTAHYVLKQELRWDPCLDVAGQRYANVFVKRGDGQAEIDRVAELADALGPASMVVIFPEGTRFSPGRKARRLAELRERNDPQLELAERLQQSLPPHSGGVAALLDAAPGVDVVFLTHSGFEGLRTVADIFAGALIGRHIRVELWRVERATIPSEASERRAWLFEQWLRVDRSGAQSG